jgi:preprotein translocase subunit SecG
MKKIIALFTAVVFALSLGVAFAQEKAATPAPAEKKAEEKAAPKKEKKSKKEKKA